MGKRELVALLGVSALYLMRVVWLFLAVPWVCLPFVIVVSPDHTHLLFLLSGTSEGMCTKYCLSSCPSLPRKNVAR